MLISKGGQSRDCTNKNKSDYHYCVSVRNFELSFKTFKTFRLFRQFSDRSSQNYPTIYIDRNLRVNSQPKTKLTTKFGLVVFPSTVYVGRKPPQKDLFTTSSSNKAGKCKRF